MRANEVVETFVNHDSQHDFLHDLTTSSEIWGKLDSDSKCIIFEHLMENDEWWKSVFSPFESRI